MTTQHRRPWLATALGIGIFLAVCITGFVLMALLAPQAPAASTPQARVLWEASAYYAPWLASA